jgi:hypothetical protein
MLRCAACRHDVANDDDVRTIDGRRFHAACVDAQHGDDAGARATVGMFARFIVRASRVLER